MTLMPISIKTWLNGHDGKQNSYGFLIFALLQTVAEENDGRTQAMHQRPADYSKYCQIYQLYVKPFFFFFSNYMLLLCSPFSTHLSFLWTRTQSLKFQRTLKLSQAGLAAGQCPWVCLYTLDYCKDTENLSVTEETFVPWSNLMKINVSYNQGCT